MKSIITILFITISSLAVAQSKSFSTLREKFVEADDVSSVRVSGFVLKTILWMAGETEWSDDFGKVKSVRVINIPQREFKERNLTPGGFKKVLAKDSFEEMASTLDNGERLTIYLKDRDQRSDLYFLLVENNSEVTAIEIRGELDPKKIIEDHQKNHLKKI
jgi:hypothetical protein